MESSGAGEGQGGEKLSSLHKPEKEELESASPLETLPSLHHGPNEQDGKGQGQMEQVEEDAEAREEEGGADAEEGAGPGQEQQQGVMGGGEEEAREPQHQPEQRGGEAGVQRQGGQEEGRQRLARRCCLETGKRNGNKRDGDSLERLHQVTGG